MKKPKWITGEFWTVYNYCDALTICEKAKTLGAAEAKAQKCERAGGGQHRILYVKECARKGGK